VTDASLDACMYDIYARPHSRYGRKGECHALGGERGGGEGEMPKFI